MKEGPLSLPSSRGDSSEQDRKRRHVKWGDLKVPQLKEKMRNRKLKVGWRKSELVEWLEVYEASESNSTRKHSSTSEFDELGDDHDEMALWVLIK